MRPGLSGISKMQLVYGHYFTTRNVTPGNAGGNGPGPQSYPCPKNECLANPVIQEVSGLPSGTSAPNTVITEHADPAASPAVQRFRLAHPDPAPAHRRADQQRAADGVRGAA